MHSILRNYDGSTPIPTRFWMINSIDHYNRYGTVSRFMWYRIIYFNIWQFVFERRIIFNPSILTFTI